LIGIGGSEAILPCEAMLAAGLAGKKISKCL